MAKTKSRDLWLEIKFVAPGATKQEVKETLIRSIQNGTYQYPRSWRVAIYWRNKFDAPMKSGEFTKEMEDSRFSSAGWDKAVTAYLERK